MEKINTNTTNGNINPGNNPNELRNKSSDTFSNDNKATSNSSSMNHEDSNLEQIRSSVSGSFNEAKNKWQDLEHAVLAKGQEAGKAGRIYIYQNPFKSVLAASAVGLLIGFLFSVTRR